MKQYHVHCPCVQCYGKAVSGWTELHHWKTAIALASSRVKVPVTHVQNTYVVTNTNGASSSITINYGNFTNEDTNTHPDDSHSHLRLLRMLLHILITLIQKNQMLKETMMKEWITAAHL